MMYEGVVAILAANCLLIGFSLASYAITEPAARTNWTLMLTGFFVFDVGIFLFWNLL